MGVSPCAGDFHGRECVDRLERALDGSGPARRSQPAVGPVGCRVPRHRRRASGVLPRATDRTRIEEAPKRQQRERAVARREQQKRLRRTSKHVVEDEQHRARTLQSWAHHPQIAAIALRIPPREVIARANRQQEQSVEVRKNGRKRGRHTEECSEPIGSHQQKGPYDHVVEA